MRSCNFALYYAALAADDAFQCELERVYGRSAADARYRMSHTDRLVRDAREAKYAADAAWLREMERGH